MQKIKILLIVSILSIVYSNSLFSQTSTDQTNEFFYHGIGVDITKFSGIKYLTNILGKPLYSDITSSEKKSNQNRIIIKNNYKNCVIIVSFWHDLGEFQIERIESTRFGNYLFGINELAPINVLIENLGLTLKKTSDYNIDEKRIYGFIYESEKHVYYVPIENQQGLYIYCNENNIINSIHWQLKDY